MRLDVLSGAGEYQPLFARIAALPAAAPAAPAALRGYALETGPGRRLAITMPAAPVPGCAA